MGEEGNEVRGMYNFTREDIDLEAIRARIARMSDTELSQAASYRFAGIFVRNLCNT